MRGILLFCAAVSIAHSRPGETSGQIKQRFGEPLTEEVREQAGTSSKTVVTSPALSGARKITTAKGSMAQFRIATKPRLTTSMHESSNLYRFGAFGIVVRYFDNQSQREEYTKTKPPGKSRLEQAEIDGILSAAGNGAVWTVQAHGPDTPAAEAQIQSTLADGKRTPGIWKANGLRAWLAGGTLIIETDGFRALQISQPANKPEPGKLAPMQGKGF